MQGVGLAIVIAYIGILITSLNVVVSLLATIVLILLNVNLCLLLPTMAGKLGVNEEPAREKVYLEPLKFDQNLKQNFT